MTNLSNASLLDENVGGNLKNARLQKIAHVAQNPELEKQTVQNEEQINQPQQQMNYQQPIQQQVERPSNDGNGGGNVEEEYVPNNLPIRNYGKKQASKDSDDNKILGMKPALFYTILGVAVIVGGYFAYKKFSGKGKGSKSSDVGSGASSSAATPSSSASIAEVPIT